MTSERAGFRFFYIDDSGAPNTGFIVYAWIEVTPERWRPGLGRWLSMRQRLYREFKVPPSHELHATKIIGGRQHPSTDQTINGSKAKRRDLIMAALECMGQNSNIACGVVYRHTNARGKEYTRERAEVYAQLIAHLDARLTADGEFAMVFMDGDGTDKAYTPAHRSLRLSTRRILEDPMFQQSHVSQWVQMADLAAWSTYQFLLKHPGKQFAWAWYPRYLAPRMRSDIVAL